MKFLVIEDDSEIVTTLQLLLDLRWPDSILVSTGSGVNGVKLVKTKDPDVVICDLGLPDINGFLVVEQIRTFSDVPILVLTARDEEINKIRALENGADDYVVKPFSSGELIARLRALGRRRQPSKNKNEDTKSLHILRGLRVDLESQEVSINDEVVKTSPKEYALIHLLFSHPGELLTKEYLFSRIFQNETHNTAHLEEYLKLLVRNVKEIIEKKAGNPTMIFEAEGKGYMLKKP